MFDPDEISKMFDPEKIKAAFATPEMPAFDFNAALNSNQKNFDAMRAANATATEAYQDFYRKQMAVFEEMMRAAKEVVNENSGMQAPEASQKTTEIYRAAMEKALENMTKLANATKDANEDAFAMIQERVKESIAELRGS